ncbi:adenosylcobinamide-GDP ribazoletransferase [Kozakia baliensis]|uniref:adenosylcobinamide-GDP ribazoletransferase n=1 Tax=Kozakia baliensis TaxID=153496 RepID=UPI00089DA847|nr:adenosylcobinamide-GDP ribazoletransferase [Kozakia baliensis]
MLLNFRRLAADLLAALGLFTRLPLGWLARWAGDVSLRRSIWLWPWVGVAIGGTTALLTELGFSLHFPPFIAALCGVMAQLLLTGALHEDGLADMADGLGGGSTIEKRLEIMRDSRIGTYGALVLITCIALRVACIAALIPYRLALLLALPGMLSRVSLLGLLASTPAARKDGLAAALLPLPKFPLWLAGVITLLTGVLFIPLYLLAASIAAVMLVVFAMRRLVLSKLGGFTGDTLGATAILSELAVLLLLVASYR